MALGRSTHLRINIAGCDKKLLNDKKYLKKFLNKMPKKVGMTLVDKARVVGVMADNPLDSGYSGSSLLSESHIYLHCFPERKFAFVDVFSCKHFDAEVATSYIVETFKATKFKCWVDERDDYFDDYL